VESHGQIPGEIIDMNAAASIDVDFSRAGEHGNGFLEELNQLREIDPIHWSPASGCWIVTRHDDVLAALRDEFPFTMDRLPRIAFINVPEEERAAKYPNLDHYLRSWIINSDPPAHTRLRKLLLKAFSKKVVEAARPYVVQRVRASIAKLKKQPQIEFNEEIARQLAGSVILEMIGLPQSNLLRLKAWANSFVEGIGVPFASHEKLKKTDDAIHEINLMLRPELEARRKEPRNDLLTAMVQASDEGEQLSLDEMLGALHVLIIAGHDSTSNTMTLGLAALSQHPESWDYMHRNPQRILECVMELMRFIAMSTSQPRFVAEDFTWHGKQLKKGDLVFLMLAGGNRDPRVFNDPEKLDFNRPNDQSLVFAPGVHHCIGHILAKLQLTEFFGALVQEFEGAELLDDRLHFMQQIAFRGLHDLNVRMLPRQAD